MIFKFVRYMYQSVMVTNDIPRSRMVDIGNAKSAGEEYAAEGGRIQPAERVGVPTEQIITEDNPTLTSEQVNSSIRIAPSSGVQKKGLKGGNPDR